MADTWDIDDGTWTGWGVHWDAVVINSGTTGPGSTTAAQIAVSWVVNGAPVSDTATSAAQINEQWHVNTTPVSDTATVQAQIVTDDVTFTTPIPAIVPENAIIVAPQIFLATPVTTGMVTSDFDTALQTRVEAVAVTSGMITYDVAFTKGDLTRAGSLERLMVTSGADANAKTMVNASPAEQTPDWPADINERWSVPTVGLAVTVTPGALINGVWHAATTPAGPGSGVQAQINEENHTHTQLAGPAVVSAAQANGIYVVEAGPVGPLVTTEPADPGYYTFSGDTTLAVPVGAIVTVAAFIQEGVEPIVPDGRRIEINALDNEIRVTIEDRIVELSPEDREVSIEGLDLSARFEPEDRIITLLQNTTGD